MKKFLTRLLIYILLLTVTVLVINALYIRNTFEFYKNDLIANVPDNIQICNFGSSHGQCSFNYEDINKTCFNFGLSGQSLKYDYRVLQNYKNKIQKGATVFIVASYIHLYTQPEDEDPNFLSVSRRYYRFLSPDLIKNYDKKTDIFVNYFPALIANTFVTVMRALIFPVYNEFRDKTTTSQQVQEETKNPRFGTIGQKRNPEALDSIYAMIETLKELGATPILITTPYIREYSDAVREKSAETLEDFYSAMKETSEKTGTKYYDYSRDERYMNDYSLFRDSNHLNKKGSRIFTNNLLKELNLLP